jgi:DNA replication protein DnaC
MDAGLYRIRQDLSDLRPGEVGMPQSVQGSYIRFPDLLMEYGDCATILGSPKKLLNRYKKIPLLILDEWLVSDISDSELYFLFELMERRSDSTSTVFCTQYRKDDWIKRLGEDDQTEAIVNRYAHTAYWIETGSMNMREYFAKPRK